VTAEIDRAEAAERARAHGEARHHYELALAAATDPLSKAYAHREFGETLAHWGELEAAIAQLEASVAARDDDPAAWHDLGILRHSVGDIPGATVALTTARDLAPADPRPRVALAAMYWKAGQREAATAEYRLLLELDLPAGLRSKVEWALGELAKGPP
jgi:Flp pilus assembly protein TadD